MGNGPIKMNQVIISKILQQDDLFLRSQMKNRLCGKASVGLTLDSNTILAFFSLERAQEKT